MQSICHMLFFPNILTVHQNALNQYTQVCAHNRGSELELVQLGGLPLLTHPVRKIAWTLECLFFLYPHPHPTLTLCIILFQRTLQL